MSDPAGQPGVSTQDGPEPLLQQSLSMGQPWRVVVISMCLCRTRGAYAEPILAEAFERWPTAARMAEAPVDLEHLIKPLGFARTRAVRVRTAALLFSRDPRPPAERVARLPGVGEYVLDAYRIVALGDLTVEPRDHALARWLREVTA